MRENEKMKYVTALGKAIIEMTPMDRESKDWVQLGLDIAKTAAEPAVNKPFPEVVRMQNAAKEYDLERVVVFPCVVEGLRVPVIRMYGGDIAAFCKHLGIILLAESECGASGANIQKLEALCGIEIYKRC